MSDCKTEDAVIDLIRSRGEVGRRKYGVSMDRQDLSQTDWLTHLQEELADALQYAERAKGKKHAAPYHPRELATKIATRLFTNGFGDQGTRLEIKRSVRMPSGPEEEVSMGGWCFEAAVDQIERAILEENALGEPAADSRNQ